MNKLTTTMPILAVMSAAALIGGFAIQAAEASNGAPPPREPIRIGPIIIGENEVRFDLRAAAVVIGESGVSIVPTPRK